MRSIPEIVEAIRSALQELEGRPEEEQVIAILWRHLAQRRPVCMGFGAPTEDVPIEAPKGEGEI